MAGLTTRWSRAAARARWAELGPVVGVPLLAAIALTALWPATALLTHWREYRSLPVATAILLVAVAVPLVLVLRGPSGISVLESALAGVAAVGLTIALAAQLDGPFSDGALWMNSWGSAAVVVLVFARPVEEAVLVATAALAAVIVVTPFPRGDAQALHIAPLAVGAAVPVTACAIAVATALRATVRNARRTGAAADAAEEQRAVADAVARQREVRFADLEETVAPLLEDIATGRRGAADPVVGQECARLARSLRADLSGTPDSLFDVLLAADVARMQERGGSVEVRDLDVGHRLPETDRILVVELVRELCAAGPATVALTVMDAEAAGQALVVIAVDGLPMPSGPAWRAASNVGTTTVENGTRWWWDAELGGPHARGR